jgi:hypothetical protein
MAVEAKNRYLNVRVPVEFPSEKVVPREGRAAWLEKWGIPPPRIRFMTKAAVKDWAAAGCEISASGHVSELSEVAMEQICWEARAVLKQGYEPQHLEGLNTGVSIAIPQDRVVVALHKAADILADRRKSATEHRQLSDEASARATEFAKTCGDEGLAMIVAEGYDVRMAVLSYLVMAFTDHCGIGPVRTSTKAGDFEERNSPTPRALSMRAELQAAVVTFEWPDFVHVHVDRVSRTRLQDGSFLTVIPIVFSIYGIQPMRVAWNADADRAAA